MFYFSHLFSHPRIYSLECQRIYACHKAYPHGQRQSSWLQIQGSPFVSNVASLASLPPWLTVLFIIGMTVPLGCLEGPSVLCWVKLPAWHLHSPSLAGPSLTESSRLTYSLQHSLAGSVCWNRMESSFLWVTSHFFKEWRKGEVLKECELPLELMGKQSRQHGRIINPAPLRARSFCQASRWAYILGGQCCLCYAGWQIIAAYREI